MEKSSQSDKDYAEMQDDSQYPEQYNTGILGVTTPIGSFTETSKTIVVA